MKILLAFDGSKHGLAGVDSRIARAAWLGAQPEVQLVAVRLPLPAVGVSKSQAQKYYQEEGEKQLAQSKKKLDAAGLSYNAQVLVGQVAETLVKHAKSSSCDLIFIGT